MKYAILNVLVFLVIVILWVSNIVMSGYVELTHNYNTQGFASGGSIRWFPIPYWTSMACHLKPIFVMFLHEKSTLLTKIASTSEAEADGSLDSRPAWSTEWFPGQPGYIEKTLPYKMKECKQMSKNCSYESLTKWANHRTVYITMYLVNMSHLGNSSHMTGCKFLTTKTKDNLRLQLCWVNEQSILYLCGRIYPVVKRNELPVHVATWTDMCGKHH